MVDSIREHRDVPGHVRVSRVCVIDTHWWTQLVNTVTYQDVSETRGYCVTDTQWWTQLVNTVTYQDVSESPDYGVFNTHCWAQLVNTVTYQDVSVPGTASLTPNGGLNS